MLPDYLYFYCSIDEFYNLVKSKKLRLYSTQQHKEQSYFDQHSETIQNLTRRTPVHSSLSDYFEPLDGLANLINDSYSICFYENYDLFNLWEKNNSNNQYDVCIEISTRIFFHLYRDVFNPDMMHISKVVYDPLDQDKFINRLFHPYQFEFPTVEQLHSKVSRLLSFFQDENKINENEWRLQYNLNEEQILGGFDNMEYFRVPSGFSLPKHELLDKKITPYIEYDLITISEETPNTLENSNSWENLSLIKGVELGNNCKNSVKEIKQFLEHNDIFGITVAQR